MNDQEELLKLKSELEETKSKAASLKRSIEHYESCIKNRRAEYTDLAGTSWSGGSGGQIANLRRKVADLELKINHSKKHLVVWNREPKQYDPDLGKIVAQVTAKRIYVCKPESTTHDLYYKDGTPLSKVFAPIPLTSRPRSVAPARRRWNERFVWSLASTWKLLK